MSAAAGYSCSISCTRCRRHDPTSSDTDTGVSGMRFRRPSRLHIDDVVARLVMDLTVGVVDVHRGPRAAADIKADNAHHEQTHQRCEHGRRFVDDMP